MKYFRAPPTANWAWFWIPKLTKTIKPNINQYEFFISKLFWNFAKSIKFGMHFTKFITQPNSIRMGFKNILPYGNYFSFINYERGMFLLSIQSHWNWLGNWKKIFNNSIYIHSLHSQLQRTRRSNSGTRSDYSLIQTGIILSLHFINRIDTKSNKC